MSVEERVLRLENAFATLSELVAASESRTNMMVTLLHRMDERMDQQLTWINRLGSAQANTEGKLAALIDAQIRTEQTLTTLTERMTGLVGAQERTDRRVDALIDIVGERPGGPQG